jgi:hypothetical protein
MSSENRSITLNTFDSDVPPLNTRLAKPLANFERLERSSVAA